MKSQLATTYPITNDLGDSIWLLKILPYRRLGLCLWKMTLKKMLESGNENCL